MANVYNTIYKGDFCDKEGDTVFVELRKRMLDTAPVPVPIPIIFAGEDSSPVVISYPDKGDYKLNPINGSECTINIKAIDSFELASLYTADEREWQVGVFGTINWLGYLIPDSCSEPFESKPYDVTISATDALGTLSDIPFQNDDGTKIKGQRSDREVLRTALAKTGLPLGMIIGVNLYEATMNNKTVNGDPLSQSFIDCQRFIAEDQTSFSCEEVIRSILVRYSARLHQFNALWQIVRLEELQNGIVQCRRYGNTGVFQGAEVLGNAITAGGEDRELQPVGNTGFAKAFLSSTAYYQYGYLANTLINGDMDTWTSKPNGLPDGWSLVQNGGTVYASTGTRLTDPGQLPTTDYFITIGGAGNGRIVNNNPVQVRANDTAKVSFDWLGLNTASVGNSNRRRYLSVLIQADSGQYYVNSGWQSNFGYYTISYDTPSATRQNTVNFDVTPLSIDYTIIIGLLPLGLTDGTHFDTSFNNVAITSGTDAATKPSIGVYDKMTQLTAQTYTQEPVVLLHADDSNVERTSLIYINGVPSTKWGYGGVDRTILQWVAFSELKQHSKPYRIFEADFIGYGQIDINTILTVDLLDGVFIFLSGSFDRKKSINTLRFAQFITTNPAYAETIKEDYGDSKDTNGSSIGSPNGVSGLNGTSYVDTAGFVTTDSLPVKATNVEAQTGADDAKFITSLVLANWWAWIRTQAFTISGIWNYTARPTYNGSNLLVTSDLSTYAPIESPAFTGNPTAPTATLGDNDTSIATTAFVQSALTAFKGSDKVLSKSANYTVLMTDFGSNGHCTVYVDTTSGNVNITPPSVTAMNGYTLNVIKTSADVNSAVIMGTINGVSNDFLANQFDAGTYKSNGTAIFKF